MIFGCCCTACLETYETRTWSPPWICDSCVSNRLRFEDHAMASAAWARWLSVGAQVGAA
jgi:hypothetical protein